MEMAIVQISPALEQLERIIAAWKNWRNETTGPLISPSS